MMPPPPARNIGAKLIDAKYACNFNNENSAWIQAGYFNVAVSINKKEWQGDAAALTALIKNLIDLETLAALSPE